jgi:hypothetical protein
MDIAHKLWIEFPEKMEIEDAIMEFTEAMGYPPEKCEYVEFKSKTGSKKKLMAGPIAERPLKKFDIIVVEEQIDVSESDSSSS